MCERQSESYRERERMRDLDLPQVSSPYKRCYSDNYRVKKAWRSGKLAEFFLFVFLENI